MACPGPAGAATLPRGTYKLTDTGDTHINTVTVLTTACDEGTLKYGDPDDNGALNPGEVWTGSCTHKVTEKIGATVKNVFTSGGKFLQASAQASVSIVAKTVATPTPASPSAEPSASPGASAEPSAAPSASSAAPATPPAATPAPTIAPAPASSEGSGFPVLLLVVAILALVAMVGGWLLYQRRRLGGVR